MGNNDTVSGDLITEIDVVYTGVYTLKYHMYLRNTNLDNNELNAEQITHAYTWLNVKGPMKFEQTFESLEGQLNAEQLDFVKTSVFDSEQTLRRPVEGNNSFFLTKTLSLAQKNLIATEIGRLVLKVGNAFHIDISMKGETNLSLGQWIAEEVDFWDYLQPKISQALLFIAAHVSV